MYLFQGLLTKRFVVFSNLKREYPLPDKIEGTVEEETSVADDTHSTTATLTINTHKFWLNVLVGYQESCIHNVSHLVIKQIIISMIIS